MSCSILINGKPESALNINDRGLQYGDGVFETIAVRREQPEFLTRHLQRLEAGCNRLGFNFPFQKELIKEIAFLSLNQHSSVIKVQISSGNSARGYYRPSGIVPNRIVRCQPFPEYSQTLYQEGINLRLCRHRLSQSPSLAGIKHLNRLDQVIARSEWSDDQIHEGVMLDADGFVIEGTMSNLFLVSNGQLITASLDRAGVSGIIRSVILEQAECLGIDPWIQVSS